MQVTGGLENVFMAHSSWFVYAATNRIFKHYHLMLKDSSARTTLLSFSSYPGKHCLICDWHDMRTVSPLELALLLKELNNFSQLLLFYICYV